MKAIIEEQHVSSSDLPEAPAESEPISHEESMEAIRIAREAFPDQPAHWAPTSTLRLITALRRQWLADIRSQIHTPSEMTADDPSTARIHR